MNHKYKYIIQLSDERYASDILFRINNMGKYNDVFSLIGVGKELVKKLIKKDEANSIVKLSKIYLHESFKIYTAASNYLLSANYFKDLSFELGISLTVNIEGSENNIGNYIIVENGYIYKDTSYTWMEYVMIYWDLKFFPVEIKKIRQQIKANYNQQELHEKHHHKDFFYIARTNSYNLDFLDTNQPKAVFKTKEIIYDRHLKNYLSIEDVKLSKRITQPEVYSYALPEPKPYVRKSISYYLFDSPLSKPIWLLFVATALLLKIIF